MKNTIIASLLIIAIGVGAYVIIKKPFGTKVAPVSTTTDTTAQATTTESANVTAPVIDTTQTVIGKSVNGNDITAYYFGEGADEILFVGGIHGGYEWNTALVAYQLMDYLKANPSSIPKNLKVTVIPVLNPDGLTKVTGTPGRFAVADVSKSEDVVVSGRFNANNVDLNRNFDCDWKTTGVWQNKKVNGGTEVFSEPESQAIKNYVETKKPISAVVWYSALGGVFASNCHGGVSAETKALTKTFSVASGYSAYQSFDFYATTGDMVNWFAKKEIPAISVLLTNHTDTEWSKNQAGILALFKYYTR